MFQTEKTLVDRHFGLLAQLFKELCYTFSVMTNLLMQQDLICLSDREIECGF